MGPREEPRVEWGLLARSFFLGAGFMLVETKAVVHMALLFGGTWTVNTVVFAAVLLMSLAGNLFAMVAEAEEPDAVLRRAVRQPGGQRAGADRLVPGPEPGGADRRGVLAGVRPGGVRGVIFSASFARSSRPNQMFGANVAGALVGGLAENASMLLGFRYLILVAAGFYLLSAWAAGRLGRAERRKPPDVED